MRVAISKGFVQTLLGWDRAAEVLNGCRGASEELVAALQDRSPATTNLTAETFDGLEVSARDRDRMLDALKDARAELQRTRPSPLVTMMGRTRSWEYGTRVKVFLTLLWKQQKGTISVDRDSVSELVDYVGSNRRSVNQSLRDLQRLRFIDLEFGDRQMRDAARSGRSGDRIPVRDHRIELRSELGDGSAYQRPDPGQFFQVGEELWTDGWVSRMPGQGLAVLLVLLSRVDSRDPTGPIWVASSQVSNWYGFSDRVWQNGVKYLRNAQLVTLHRQGTYKYDHKPSSSNTTKSRKGDPSAANSADRRKFYAPDGITHPWLVPAATEDTADPRGTPPDGAHLLYLKQNRKLAVPFRYAVEKLRAEYEIARTPAERYRGARELVRFARDELNTPEHSEVARKMLVAWCRVQISHSPAYLETDKKRKGEPHEGYRHLVSLLEQDEKYREALEVAQEAKAHGWGRARSGPSDWGKTIERLELIVHREARQQANTRLPDDKYWDPFVNADQDQD